MAVRVKNVQKGSAAERLGLTTGSMLYSADGNEINDMLDYQFYTSGTKFELAVMKQGKLDYLQVEKGDYEPLGCEFETYLIDQKHSCSNHCMFCFIDQLPPGLRDTLYFKDDDERLSFLFGNYVTLTNLSDHEVERIKKMHISPINISVHTTDPALRVRMMANKRAGETLKYLDEFAEAGIQMNCQLVLCRGVNDGDALRRSLEKLTGMYPAVQSIAAVPSGLTRYRKGLYKLEPYDAASSAAVLDILEEQGAACKKKYGARIVYPGDEWYLCAGRPIPPGSFYEDYAQLENGVGMWRLFRDEFMAELQFYRRRWPVPRRIDVVTGILAAPLITEMTRALTLRHPTVQVAVHPIRNDFFGGNVSVAGLVTATDIVAQCKGRLKSRHLGVPDVMLRAERDRFLDDWTIQDLEKALKVKVHILPSGGGELVKALLAPRLG
ncbi:Fe-S oxidoreductase [Oscillospiraceae bacterium]|nr:Fe-S oxidoreductase [Oscillospiraceae bacterium]